MKKILIGITTAETVWHEVMESIYNLRIPNDIKVDLKVVHAYEVSNGRNELVDRMLAGGYDYIFFVDSDVVLPNSALEDLIAINEPLAAGIYIRKELASIGNRDPYTTLYYHGDYNKDDVRGFGPFFLPLHEIPKGQIIPIDCCGMGCTLIKKEVFEKLKKPYFFFAHEGDPNEKVEGGAVYCIGEDMYFCREMVRHNIPMFGVGSVRCGHIGKFIFEPPK